MNSHSFFEFHPQFISFEFHPQFISLTCDTTLLNIFSIYQMSRHQSEQTACILGRSLKGTATLADHN